MFARSGSTLGSSYTRDHDVQPNTQSHSPDSHGLSNPADLRVYCVEPIK